MKVKMKDDEEEDDDQNEDSAEMEISLGTCSNSLDGTSKQPVIPSGMTGA